MSKFTISLNDDNTVTVRVGRLKIHVDSNLKTEDELVDAIRWAAVTLGVRPDEHVVRVTLRAERHGRMNG